MEASRWRANVPRPRDRGIAPLLAVAVLGLGAQAAPAKAAKTCRSVRGHQVLKTATVRVVSQRFRTIYRKGATQMVGHRYLGCTLPQGKPYEVGRRYREYSFPGRTKGSPLVSGAVALGPSAGTFVVADDQQANLTGDFAEKTNRVFNLATGGSYIFWHNLLGGQKKEPAPPSKILVNSRGQLAGIFVNPASSAPTDYSDPAPGQSEVVTFSADGTRHVLDSGPTSALPESSLTLTDSVVRWTNAGQPKSATIP